MAQTFDVAFKSLFRRSNGVLSHLLFGDVIEWPNVEQPEVRNRRADLLARSADGSLRHVELQTKNEPGMPLRMLEYYAGFYRHFGQHLQQTLLYAGREPLRMDAVFATPSTRHEFTILNLREMDGAALLASDDWADNEWALLTKTDPEQVMRVVFDKLHILSGGERRDAANTFVILGGILGIAKEIEKRLQNEMIDLMENEVLGPAIRKGRAQGMAHLLQTLLERRFGKLPLWAQDKLASATPETLEAWTLRLDDSSALETILR